jgi:glycosyltransferase involved in cell wall biosynthesis
MERPLHTDTHNPTQDWQGQIVLSHIDGRPADHPLVSAIIPAYNAAAFIRRTIESALAQTHHLLEIIVVDDGSTDETTAVAAGYPVTVIRQENGGVASARNAGAKAASGEWLAFLDHDDLWHADKTEQQLKYAVPGISAVFSGKYPGTAMVSFAEMFACNWGGNPSSTIIRADVLRELEFFDDDRALMGVDDYNLWLRFLLNGYRYSVSPSYYEFTPEENHYSGNPEKMLSADLVNIDKIAALANLDRETVLRRKRVCLLKSMPNLIWARKLHTARHHLRSLGLDRETARYWVAFLPAWVLDLRRTILKWPAA